ncbi:DUF3027 domain-containing protein [Arthrobacter oryzae]|uniref:DUF3027 domain-containing protein n=1 Tax=Arthrobacter oryzae TaxID=409290 RepID=UPI0030CA0824
MTSQPDQGVPKPASKPRAGVPVWRTGKPDAVLAAAVDLAREAIEGIAPAEQIGQHLAAKSEGDRVVTHLFESRLAGYQGWQWYAVMTRNSRSKVITVNELGLLPSADSILAPEWVPWAERVRPEDAQENEADGDAHAADADVADAALAAFEDDVAVSDDGAAASDDDDVSDDADAPEDEEHPDSSREAD